MSPNVNGCIRCGQEGHRWGKCHLPFQKVIARPTRNGPNYPKAGKATPTLNVNNNIDLVENDARERPQNTGSCDGTVDNDGKSKESESEEN